MLVDISGLTPKELDAPIAKAKQRKTTLKKRKPIAKVRSKLAAVAKVEGYSLDELFGVGRRVSAATAKPTGTGRKLGKVAPKYRNPANPAETWSGRGKHPRWLVAQVAQGKKVEDFLIEAAGGRSKKASSRGGAVRKAGREAAAKRGRKTARKSARKTPAKARKQKK